MSKNKKKKKKSATGGMNWNIIGGLATTVINNVSLDKVIDLVHALKDLFHLS